MSHFFKILYLLAFSMQLNAQHPVTFFTKKEVDEVKRKLDAYPLIKQSYTEIKSDVDEWTGKDIDVPFPKDPAGGYTHDRHRANYMLMFNSGVLYNLTGETKYATLVKNILLKYAALNPTLKNHPQATSSSPGRIFWQALNDANWMVYTGMAYDLIYNSLSASERKTIENGAFKPEVDYFTTDLKSWVNLLHNHAVWANAGIGMIGIATQDQHYIDMALYGTEKDGKRGFLALMDNLFSPDGYYTEGPYYTRYAILPYAVFANAINNYKPALKIFEHRDKILLKALNTCLQQTNTNGMFFPLNDAIKDKDYTTSELVTAINIFWNKYGPDDNFLYVAKQQNRVMLNKGGMEIAKKLATPKSTPAYFNYKTLESADGTKGDAGGVSFIRSGPPGDLSTLIFKYASHGLSHGHYDELNINLFDKGNEILTDYGSVRFVGVEQKYGGRYLPENKTYATQTIAHNTIVVDETSQFNGDEDEAEKYHSEKLFSNYLNPAAQVLAAKETNAYTGVSLHRTLYSLVLPGGKKIFVDLFNTISSGTRQFDLPFQFSGQFINSSFKYEPFTNEQETLGTKNGYQFIWKEAETKVANTTAQFTFLNGKSYYSISTLITDSAQLFFTRTGANDPDFNLRSEPAFIIRKKGQSQSFISVVEVHGKYDPVYEFSSNAYPSVKQIKVLQHDSLYSVAEIVIGDKKLVAAQCNKNFDGKLAHAVQGINWTGPFVVLYDDKKL